LSVSAPAVRTSTKRSNGLRAARAIAAKDTTEVYDPRKCKHGFFFAPLDLRQLRGKYSSGTEIEILAEIMGELYQFGRKDEPARAWSSVFTIEQLAEWLHSDKRSIERALGRMLAIGMIEQKKVGSKYQYRPAPWNWAAIPTYREYQAQQLAAAEAEQDVKPTVPPKPIGAPVEIEPGRKCRRITLSSGLQVQPRAAIPCSIQFAETVDGLLDVEIRSIDGWRTEGGTKAALTPQNGHAAHRKNGKTKAALTPHIPERSVENTRREELLRLLDVWFVDRGLIAKTGSVPTAMQISEILRVLGDRPLEQFDHMIAQKQKRITSAAFLINLAKDCTEPATAATWDRVAAARARNATVEEVPGTLDPLWAEYLAWANGRGGSFVELVEEWEAETGKKLPSAI
jgi:hypothetical protein